MINSIQYLRTFAAIIVVLFHANGTAYDYFDYLSPLDSLFKQGGVGVDIFFVISGFIIAFMVIEKNQNQQIFLINRLSRIAPPYWLITALITILFYFSNHLFKQLEINTYDIIGSLTFSSWMFNQYPIVYVGWTLSYELLFYLSVVIFFQKFKQLTIYSLLITTISISLLALLFEHFFEKTEQGLALLFFLQFISGTAIFLRRHSRISKRQYYIFIIIIFTIEYLCQNNRILFGNITGVLLLTFALWFEKKHKHYFKYKFPLLLGDASYAIYLIQVLTIPAIGKLLLFSPLSSILPKVHTGAIYILLATCATIITGVLFYYFVEKPLFSFSKKMISIIIPEKSGVKKLKENLIHIQK